eukprot:7528348-Pyramimonas_sp.AAC.1
MECPSAPPAPAHGMPFSPSEANQRPQHTRGLRLTTQARWQDGPKATRIGLCMAIWRRLPLSMPTVQSTESHTEPLVVLSAHMRGHNWRWPSKTPEGISHNAC